MTQRITTVFSLALSLAFASGCADSMGNPTSPTVAASGTAAAADGSTLKVTAPTLQSPISGIRIQNLEPEFRIQNASARFGSMPGVTYRFEVQTMAGVVVATSGAVTPGPSTTSWEIPTQQTLDTRYRWRARAEFAGRVGPWSSFGEYLTIDYRGINPRPANGAWPRNSDDLIAYMNRYWSHYMNPTALTATRIEHMEFLRDRMIEAGICGGIDLARNLKRGVGPHSHDAIAWRKSNGFVEVVDIASAFDDKTIPLRLHWQIVVGPSGYDRYPNHPGC